MFEKITAYIKQSVEELKKVTWPTKKETYHYSLAVILVSAAVAVFLGGLDYLFSNIIKLIL